MAAPSRSASGASGGTAGSSRSSRASLVCTWPRLSRASARTAAYRLPPASKTRPTRHALAAGARAWAITFSLPHRGTVPYRAKHRPSISVLLPEPVGPVRAKKFTSEKSASVGWR